MTKSQELHIKHLYSTGEDSLDNANNPEGVQDPTAITVDEVQTERKQKWRQRSSGEGDEHSTPSTRNYTGNFKNEKQTSQRYNNFQHRDGEGDKHSTPPTQQNANSDQTPLLNAIQTSYTQILVTLCSYKTTSSLHGWRGW